MYILVVDDNKDICTLIQSILLSENHEVKVCCNPLKAHEIIDGNPPAMVITDMLMSGTDGLALSREIKADPANRDVKIMMMSAHPDAAEISRNAGFDDFLPKPFEIDELIAKVSALLPKKD